MTTQNTVLIIEDNLPNLIMARDLLRMGNFQTLQAENGETGIRLAKEHRPDLILMDMHLPMMDGYEASRVLKTGVDTQDIVIVAFTALAMEDEKERALANGCSGVISKPINVDQFAQTVRDLLEHARKKQPAQA